ncbi:YdcF family protein [Kitasatospora viridis]|uniref:DUF218 domain-containing protein n=1 Tax=Kitasatospora viridis TaxID=281105 RepID=A0A561TVZ9_9ACTN|nr:YdcF family protein [Kitasatospora viridis]TWF91281.1 DUF218 domain-containing protein [Kitasatospora viridis]
MTDVQQPAITDRQWQDATSVWEFHQMKHELRSCDAAIGLGSHDLGVPAFAAQLFHEGFFPTVVFSGGPNPTHPDRFPRGEAAHFTEHAVALGVPGEAVLQEPKARNTGQNIEFSREVLATAGVEVKTVMLISMPFMERRAYATCRQVWPEVEVVCASAPMELDDYVKVIGGDRLVIDHLVGDLQRVIAYPRLGFAIEQEVPEVVHAAYQRLLADGFDSRLLGS